MRVEDLERWIIGHMFLDDSVDVSTINKKDFSNQNLGLIFEYLKNKLENNEPIDIFSASHDLKIKPESLDELIDSIPPIFNFENAVKKLKEESIKRQLKDLTKQINENLENNNIYEVLNYVEQKILGIDIITERPFKTFNESISTFWDELEQVRELTLQGKINGIPSGITDLDKFIGGFKPEQLVIIAGRPSMGKTTFALNIATNMAKNGNPSAFFSLEMGQKNLRDKIIASFTHIDYQKIENKFLNQKEQQIIQGVLKEHGNTPILLGDTTHLTIESVKSLARKLKREYKIKALFLDYLQLMAKTTELVKELGMITRQLKLLAVELKIPIFLLSQLSRQVEHRENKRPLMADLRDSGAIEQDADIILFLYRPAYYQRYKKGNYEEEPDKAEKMEVIVGKNRNGRTGIIELGFFGKYSHFFDLALVR
ncbi:hypothetical protein X275_01215 [Marinitoga sp. 1197]|uniref:replicative DNA helicase n=1 Tax=Marinitoga sp. 1197 TaxID=1428449 RepID=UPI0006416A3C|nr:replicative DNA helicase [Marinitoga sp. 1197]AJW76892.1 replicative DNA helicase [Marinitoga camini virus 1]KLO24041.1 hypothetical protein X275_01215 [Marinitoga sp. 1197]